MDTKRGQNNSNENIENDEPLYTIEDQEETTENNQRENPENDDSSASSPLSPFRILIKTMLTPVEGWKALRRASFPTDDVASKCFYPLIAIAAISDAAQLFYEANVSISDWAVNGLITFITFFFGYFSVLFAGGVILPKGSKGLLKTDKGKQFVMISMSTLAIFWTLIQILPMFEPVLVFLPLWTIYIIIKGVKVMRVPQNIISSTSAYLCLLIIGTPIFWNWIFTEFLLP